MKNKLTVFLVAFLVIFSACTSKWDKQDPNMPEEYKQQQEEILQEHLDILEEDPENVDSLLEVGFRYQVLGDYKNAEKYYKKLLEIDENHYPALNNLADIYEEIEEYELAATHIKKLYENNPNTPEVIKDTVRILLKAGEPKNAQAALENFARIRQENEDTSADQLISDLFESIHSYKQEHETN